MSEKGFLLGYRMNSFCNSILPAALSQSFDKFYTGCGTRLLAQNRASWRSNSPRLWNF